MPLYRYRAVTTTGEMITGIEQGTSTAAVAEHLSSRRLLPVDVREKRRFRIRLDTLFPSTASNETRLQAIDHLATLLDAGLPLTVSLFTIAEQMEHRGVHSVFRDLAIQVENGRSLSEAAQRHPRYFPDLHLNMIRAGERSGKLPDVLRRLAEQMEREESVRRKLVEASIYPVIILCLAAVIVGLLLTFVVPHFVELLERTGVALPAPTRILIAVSDALREYGLLFAGTAVLFAALLPRLLRIEKVRYARDTALIRMPIIRGVVKRAAIARFARTLGTLITSGLPFLPSLLLVSPVLGNLVLRRAVERIHDAVEGGEDFAAPLRRETLFPPMVVQMVAVGEATGTLDTMLRKVGDLYDKELDSATKKMTAVIEPALIVVIGVVVGFVALALVLPMLKAVSGLGH